MARTLDSPKRTESYKCELLDDNGNGAGEVHPINVPVIACATGDRVGRTISTLRLDASEAARVDPNRHRLKPIAIINGTPYAQGLFVFTGRTWHTKGTGREAEYQLHDQSFLLYENTTLTDSFGIRAGDPIAEGLADLADRAGIIDPVIVDTPAVAGNHLGWPPGTAVGTILTSLARLAGLTRPWFTRDGVMRMSFLPYAGLDKPRRKYVTGATSPITGDGFQESDDWWNAWNEWRVISKGATATVSGTWRLPDGHPFSQKNTGRRRQLPVDIPGLASTAEAEARARDEAQRYRPVHPTRQFKARMDPTLELYDTVTFEDADELLDAWDVTLAAGVDSTVTLRGSLLEDSSL